MKRLLLDTSVWSEALRRKETSIDSSETIVRKIIENSDEIVIIGIILQEILSGITNEKLLLVTYDKDFINISKYTGLEILDIEKYLISKKDTQ